MTHSDVTRVPDDLTGVVLEDRYRVIAPLNAGGMGTIYKAEHRDLGPCVIKVLQGRLAQRDEWIKRVIREAQAARRIGHENVVRVMDCGRTPNGSVYYVMEHLEGEDLARRLAHRARGLPWAQARPLIIQLCSALIAVHRQGVVHRDIKPANCMLVPAARGGEMLKLVDFGIAKVLDADEESLTQAGVAMGTAQYMAPEQADGRSIDQRADVYSAGATIFHLLTGRPPFEGKTVLHVLKSVLEAPPPLVHEAGASTCVPREIDAILHRSLEKEPEKRFPTVEGLLQAIERLPAATDPAGSDARTSNYRWVSMIALGATVALVATTGAWWYGVSHSGPPAGEAALTSTRAASHQGSPAAIAGQIATEELDGPVDETLGSDEHDLPSDAQVDGPTVADEAAEPEPTKSEQSRVEQDKPAESESRSDRRTSRDARPRGRPREHTPGRVVPVPTVAEPASQADLERRIRGYFDRRAGAIATTCEALVSGEAAHEVRVLYSVDPSGRVVISQVRGVSGGAIQACIESAMQRLEPPAPLRTTGLLRLRIELGSAQ